MERTIELLSGLDHLVVQDIFLTATAELADVVFPAAASWCESEGTVTSSERRVQRVRKALEPAAGRPRRYGDHLRDGLPRWATTGATRPPKRSGTSCVASRPGTAA